MAGEEASQELAQAELYRQRYLADQIETASPEQRLLMLFDHLLRDLDDAIEAFATHKIEAINNHLLHAQQILFALRDPLDRETPLGESLSSVYTFCINHLIDANLRKDPRPIGPAREMLQTIANANRAAAEQILAVGRTSEFRGVA